jgi:pyruvate, orthophosphate dikinase
MGPRFVYRFEAGQTEGHAGMSDLLGGKGANLAEMARLGLPVPPGFTLSTLACRHHLEHGEIPQAAMDAVEEAVGWLEGVSGQKLGDPERPMLVSVRSGAPVSMPGMMDTILNLGATPDTVGGLASRGGARFALDARRRFLQMYGEIIDGVPSEAFESILSAAVLSAGVRRDADLSEEALRGVVAGFEATVRQHNGSATQEPKVQLMRAIEAIVRSWGNPRARTYRRLNAIPSSLGTAVNVQLMVFGNLGPRSGSGVGFTRDPATGRRIFYGEYLSNAQGEDVVAGTRTPLPVRADRAASIGLEGQSLEDLEPAVHARLMEVAGALEGHYGDVQDLEFTYEDGEVYVLQTRRAKRTGRAWVVTQADLVDEGSVEADVAFARIPAESVSQLLAPGLDAVERARARVEGMLLATGLGAGPGCAVGRAAFTADDAERRTAEGEAIILVREDTTPDDVHGIHAARGILTARGGMTSHAAVVARGMGTPCIVGCGALRVDPKRRLALLGGHTIKADTVLTIDGATGEVFLGALEVQRSPLLRDSAELDADELRTQAAFDAIMAWADRTRTLGVLANAETPEDITRALELGAEGVGLCRTEHMFFHPDRLEAVRLMILAGTSQERAVSLARIEPMQTEDFRELFRVMGGRKIIVRMLDPPLHEFLPRGAHAIEQLAKVSGLTTEVVRRRVDRLREANPMLGHRGCRLGMSIPELTRMQARAIGRAVRDVRAEGTQVTVQIMIPLVGHVGELLEQKEVIEAELDGLEIKIGTMIEVPRAALTAAEIAQVATFFSFGTNDLTQMTLGLSRDDAGTFLEGYIERGIYAASPFSTLDLDGVGRLMRLAVDGGRSTSPDLEIGVCGEHGGDPRSIALCQELGLDYVSCSPLRVPVARLACAQVALASRR